LGVAAFTDDALDAPFGTGSVVEVTATPLVGVGQQATLVIEAISAVRASGERYGSVQGFAASILVTPPGVLVQTEGEELAVSGEVTVSHPTTGEPVGLSRAGTAVRCWELDMGGASGDGRLHPASVRPVVMRTRDPGAPREVAPCGPADVAEPFGVVDTRDVISFVDAFARVGSVLGGSGERLDRFSAFMSAYSEGCAASDETLEAGGALDADAF